MWTQELRAQNHHHDMMSWDGFWPKKCRLFLQIRSTYILEHILHTLQLHFKNTNEDVSCASSIIWIIYKYTLLGDHCKSFALAAWQFEEEKFFNFFRYFVVYLSQNNVLRFPLTPRTYLPVKYCIIQSLIWKYYKHIF